MNLFDLLGQQQSGGVKPVQPTGGGFARFMPMSSPAAPVGTSQALAAFGPSINKQLQDALARMRAQQFQQQGAATSANTDAGIGAKAQQSIDDQTAALIAQRLGISPSMGGAGGGVGASFGDLYMQ